MVAGLRNSALALAVSAALALAGAGGQLLIARQALEKGDLATAEKAFSRALQAPEASAQERKEALEGLAGLVAEPERAARVVALLEEQLDRLPEDQRAPVLDALVVCLKARDGSLRSAFALLGEASRNTREREVRRVYSALAEAWQRVGREVARLASEFRKPSALRPLVHEKPRRSSRSQRRHSIELAEPKRPVLELRLTRVAPPHRSRHRSVERVVLRAPQPFRYRLGAYERVVKPPARRRLTAASLASVLFSRAYRRASQLAAQGLYEAAKAQYATFMELFPDSPRIQHAARYALQLFRRERGAAQETRTLVAYLRWLEAIFGPKGHDYAEYLAFSYLADDADPVVVAREAEAFIKRHPDSRYVPGVRLELAVALDAIGSPRRAIEVLRPVAATIDTSTRAKAAYILAWLLIFQGEGAEARGVLQRLAEQKASDSYARSAKRLLEQMAARPLPKTSLPELPVGQTADEALAKALLAAGDAFLRKGDVERAMDLYDLFLQLCEDAPGYYAARLRIERLKQTGKLEDF